MDGCEVKNRAGMIVQPLYDLLFFMETWVVADNMNAANMVNNDTLQVIQKSNQFDLPFLSEASPIDVACGRNTL